MGMLRLVLKPTFSFLHSIFGAVGYKAGDAEVTVIEQSLPVKYLTYALDWFASIKLAQPSVIVVPPQIIVSPAPVAVVQAPVK